MQQKEGEGEEEEGGLPIWSAGKPYFSWLMTGANAATTAGMTVLKDLAWSPAAGRQHGQGWEKRQSQTKQRANGEETRFWKK